VLPRQGEEPLRPACQCTVVIDRSVKGSGKRALARAAPDALRATPPAEFSFMVQSPRRSSHAFHYHGDGVVASAAHACILNVSRAPKTGLSPA
jgi:hypothetical protein